MGRGHAPLERGRGRGYVTLRLERGSRSCDPGVGEAQGDAPSLSPFQCVISGSLSGLAKTVIISVSRYSFSRNTPCRPELIPALIDRVCLCVCVTCTTERSIEMAKFGGKPNGEAASTGTPLCGQGEATMPGGQSARNQPVCCSKNAEGSTEDDTNPGAPKMLNNVMAQADGEQSLQPITSSRGKGGDSMPGCSDSDSSSSTFLSSREERRRHARKAATGSVEGRNGLRFYGEVWFVRTREVWKYSL